MSECQHDIGQIVCSTDLNIAGGPPLQGPGQMPHQQGFAVGFPAAALVQNEVAHVLKTLRVHPAEVCGHRLVMSDGEEYRRRRQYVGLTVSIAALERETDEVPEAVFAAARKMGAAILVEAVAVGMRVFRPVHLGYVSTLGDRARVWVQGADHLRAVLSAYYFLTPN